MGRLSFGKDQSRSESVVVKWEFDAEVGLDCVERRVSRLAELLLRKTGSSCDVLGEDGKPTGTFERLSGMAGLMVLRQASLMPQALFFLRSIVASEGGLVRLTTFLFGLSSFRPCA